MSNWALFVAFATVVIAVLLVVNRLTTRVRMAHRMTLAGNRRGGTVSDATFAERSADLRSGIARFVGSLGRLMPLGENDRHKIAVALQRAGYQASGALAIVLGVKTVGVLAGLAVGLAVVPPLLPGIVGWGAGAVAGVFVGVILAIVPELVVARLAAARMRRIQGGLADAFDLMIVCLESGLTFERALHRTTADLRTFHADLAGELRRASLEMAVHGRTREDALRRLADRLDSRDLRDLATTVAQSERHGTPLADSIRKLASSFRVQTVTAMQAKMARLPILLILPTVAFVLPGILVLVGGPALVQMIDTLGSFGD